VTALSTIPYGGSTTLVFFFGTDKQLHYMNETSPNSGFHGTANCQVPTTPVYMTSVGWQNTNGNQAFSIWWNDASGDVYTCRYDQYGNWQDGQSGAVPGVYGIINPFSMTVTVTADGRTEDLWAADGRQYQATSTGGDFMLALPPSRDGSSAQTVNCTYQVSGTTYTNVFQVSNSKLTSTISGGTPLFITHL